VTETRSSNDYLLWVGMLYYSIKNDMIKKSEVQKNEVQKSEERDDL